MNVHVGWVGLAVATGVGAAAAPLLDTKARVSRHIYIVSRTRTPELGEERESRSYIVQVGRGSRENSKKNPPYEK
jgi:hypothetical protein